MYARINPKDFFQEICVLEFKSPTSLSYLLRAHFSNF